MSKLSFDEYSDLLAAIRYAGYIQQDCNDEGLVDFGDATRIACEDENDVYNSEKTNFLIMKADEQDIANIEADFNSEFQVNQAVPGSDDFWSDLANQFNVRVAK